MTPGKRDAKAVAGGERSEGFTKEERAAMRERAQELKAATRRRQTGTKADGESEVRAKLATMGGPDRALGERLHEIIRTNAPTLEPRLWYGMPAYANSEGDVVCFFQPAEKFKARYATLGFSDEAKLDEGRMWPTTYALTSLTPADEAKVAALLKRALG